MDGIRRLVEQLHSPNKDKRYEACEWLRVAPSLPQTALDALEQATHDADPLVADSARRAVALHTEPVVLTPSLAMSGASTAPAMPFWGQPFITAPGAALFAYAVIAGFPFLSYQPQGPVTFRLVYALMVCFGGFPAPLLLGLMCAAFARRARNAGSVGAIAGAFLGGTAGIFAALFGWMPG